MTDKRNKKKRKCEYLKGERREIECQRERERAQDSVTDINECVYINSVLVDTNKQTHTRQ